MRMWTYLSPGYPLELFEAMADRIGAELVIGSGGSGPDPTADPFRSGDADLGWICSTSFAELSGGAEPTVREVGVAWQPIAETGPAYHGAVVVRRGDPASGLLDLRGRAVAGNDRASLSGHHSYRFALHALGEDPDTFADHVLTGAHRTSLDRLLAGQVDAAVIDSILLARETRIDKRVADELVVIDRLGPWPTQPLVARRDLPDELVTEVRERLLATPDRRLRDALDDAGLVALRATAADHCDEVVRRFRSGRSD